MGKIHLKKHEPETPSPLFSSVLMPILYYKRMTYTVVAVSVMVTLIYCLLIPNWYTSTATILPTGNAGGLSSLSSLATGSIAKLGLGAMLQADENSSSLYPKILTSRLISEKILNRRYQFTYKKSIMSKTLNEYIGAANIDKALEKLDKLMSIDVDSRTGVIRLSVMTEYPELSAAVVHAYLEELNDYNVNSRQSKGKANKQFISKRLNEVSIELNNSEDALKLFQHNNLNYASANDPSLRQEYLRLQREVSIKETVMLELTKRFEIARVEAARDLPIVQVIDYGSVPIIKSKPHRTMYLLSAFLGSLFFSVVLSLWLDLARKGSLAARLQSVLTSPELDLNSMEEKIFTTAFKTINRMKHRLEKTDRESVSGQ